MTRSLSSRQSELTQRDARRPVPLVVLTTYSDRQAKTVDTVFYFSDRAALYDYANTATTRQFWPFLMQIGDLVSRMTHLPSPSLPTIENVTVKFHNGEIEPGGLRLSEHLRTKNVEFATVEIAELDLDREPDYCDFTSLVGDEHVVWYRGELVKMGSVSESEFALTFETIIPRIPWSVLSDATTNDLRDLGKRKHIVYGAAPRVPLHATTAAARTTLAEAMSAGSTGNFLFTDTTGFSNGSASIGGEIVTFTVTSATQLNITARAQNSTISANHLAGTAIFEVLASAEWTAAGHIVDAISNVYAHNPYNDELFRLTSGTHYTGTVNDGGVATVEITNTQLVALLAAATESAVVTTQANSSITQPVVSHPVRATAVDQHPVSGSANLIDDNTSTGDSIAPAGNTGNVTFTDLGTIVEQRVYVWVDGVASNLELRTGGGTLLGTITSSSSGVYSFPTAIDTHTFYVVNIGASARGVNEFTRTMTYDVDSPSRTTDVNFANSAIVAAEVGFALDLYADLRGYEASGTDYSVGAGTMLAHPSDIIRHLIASVCGEGMGAVEDSSFDTSVTNLGSAAFACAIDELASVDASILALLAFQARSNLIPIQTSTAQQWRLSQAQTTYDFPAATLPTITEGEWSYEGIDADEISTRFRAVYDRDPFLGDGIEAYRAVVRIDTSQNDVSVPSTANLTAAEASFGRRELDAIALPAISSLATAEDLLGYIAHESIRAPRTWIGSELPWWDTYTLELGDIVNIEPDWIASAIKGRVVSYRKSFDSQLVELGVVEVE